MAKKIKRSKENKEMYEKPQIEKLSRVAAPGGHFA